MKKIIQLLSIFIAFWGCATKDVTPPPVLKSAEKAILTFSFKDLTPVVNAIINQNEKTIVATVPFGTDRAALKPEITSSSLATVSPASGAIQNFANPVVYTVTAEDGSIAQYTVTISVALNAEKEIKTFVFNGLTPAISCVVNQATGEITATVAPGTAISNLVPTIGLSNNATCSPASGVAQDFSKPVSYSVTAQDGSVKTYTVRLTTAAYFLNLIKVVSSWETYNANTWERQHPVFKTNDMQIFMVCIWNTTAPKVSLYKFTPKFNPLLPEYVLGGDAWVAHRESFSILNVDIANTSSSNLTRAFKLVFDKVVSESPSQHYGMKYSGHGVAAGGLFELKISVADTKDLLSYFNSIIHDKIDFLDWNTNCNGAAFELLNTQYPYARFILASDILRGGHNFDINEYFEWQHEQKIHTFFSPAKTIKASLVEMINSERHFWASPITKQHMTTGKVMQSISIFDTGKFESLKSGGKLNEAHQVDALKHIRQNYPTQEPLFNEFRFHYISNKDFFSWPVETNGLFLN